MIDFAYVRYREGFENLKATGFLSLLMIFVMCIGVLLFGCQKLPETADEIQSEEDVSAFLDVLEKRYEKNCIRMGQANWKSMMGEHDTGFDQVQNEFAEMLLNPVYRDIVNGWRFRGSNKVKDLELRRRLVIWSRCFMGAEVEGKRDIVTLEQALEDRSLQFQFTLDDEPVPRTELNRIIRTDPNGDQRRKAWEAFGQLSQTMESDLRKLIAMRNMNAILFGAPVDYGYLSLFVQAIELDWLLQIIAQLEERTREPYMDMIESFKKVHDLETLHPWDLQYAMHSLAYLPDEYFPGTGSVPTLQHFLKTIGFQPDILPIHVTEDPLPYGVLGMAIEIPKDVRLVVDPKPGHRFYSTLFSECGRGLYAVHIQPKRPIYKGYHWVAGAHSPAYTEAMAEILAEFTRDPYWLKKYAQLPDDALQQYVLRRVGFDLYSIRSLMSMVSFELEAYKDLGQDLHKLEKDMDRKYLLVDVPEDMPSRWGSMSYLVSSPMYYQNYLLAALITVQVHQTLREQFGLRMINQPEVAQWLIENLYAPGESQPWKTRIRNATGKDLTIDAFMEKFPGSSE